MSYRLSLNHLLFSGKRLARCFIATALACQLVTNTAMAESSGRGANVTTVHEPTTRLDTPLREKTAPRVVSPKRLVADGALVGHGGEASTLADNNLAASTAAERGIEAREIAEASSNGPARAALLTTAELTASLEYDILSARLKGDLTLANTLSQSLQANESTQLMGLALEIDNLATELSWDTSNTQYDARIRTLASTLIEHCKRKFNRVPAIEAFHCGRGHFALSFLSGVRGVTTRPASMVPRPFAHSSPRWIERLITSPLSYRLAWRTTTQTTSLVCKNGRTTFVVYTLWLIAQEPSLLTRRHRSGRVLPRRRSVCLRRLTDSVANPSRIGVGVL